MKKPCSKYTKEIISQFVDNELDPDSTMELSSHLEICPDCAKLVAKFQTIDIVFSNHAATQAAQISPLAPHPLGPGKPGGLFGWTIDHLAIKLASLTAVAVLMILAVFQWTPPPGDPSAIVKSLDTNASSVMIIETLSEKHTIIWFSET